MTETAPFRMSDGALMRAFDWSKTALGPVDNWPQSLKTTVRIMLTSRYAMWMCWGPDLTFFCNDAYSPTLGVKQTWAIGSRADKVWEEIWPDIGPRIQTVLKTSMATWDERLLLFLERSGYVEETYHTFSYSPLADDGGAITGMLCVVTEDTERVIGERRLRTLRELGLRTLQEAKTPEEACAVAAKCLSTNPHDVPFAIIYLLDDGEARLAGITGIALETPGSPAKIDLNQHDLDRGWPLGRVASTTRGELVADIIGRFGPLPCGPWSDPPRSALVLPIAQAMHQKPAGFFIAGINPRRIFDDDYRSFLELAAGHVGMTIATTRAYEQERRRAEALAELDRAKTTFFSNVSHEFRTPLTLMLGPVEDALARSTEPKLKDELELIHRNALRLQKLVNALLDFSRIEAGRVQANYEPTDLPAFTAELASVFRSAVERAGMRLIVDCEPIAEPAYVDRDMWEKVLLNLISNAFKFTFEGTIEVSIRGVSREAILRVRDTGNGIPDDQLPHIFERFHRVEETRARTHEGTGIGLSLVQELVKLHGGSIGVESVLGAGTTFTVKLPLGRAHLPKDRVVRRHTVAVTSPTAGLYVEEALRWLPNQADESDSVEISIVREGGDSWRIGTEPRATAGRPRILLADDNADLRAYLTRLLSERFHVEAVADGQAALTAAKAIPPELVLTDVMMPKLDGFGLVQQLRSDPATAAIPVLMLSARAGEEARVEGLHAGADDYIVKPFGTRELMARVSGAIELARVRREVAAANERAAIILESITDGFLAIDAEWRITHANAEAERLVAMSRTTSRHSIREDRSNVSATSIERGRDQECPGNLCPTWPHAPHVCSHSVGTGQC